MESDCGAAVPDPKKGRSRREGRARRGKIEETIAFAAWAPHRALFGENGHDPPAFGLELRMTVSPGARWRVDASPSLHEQVAAALRVATARERVFHPGRVYCYRCEESTCPHAVPPDPGKIFVGYSSTGLPRWQDLSQVMLEMRHPDVDALYEQSGRELASVFMDGESLKARQLDVFGRQSKTYDILAQASFGYLRLVPASGGEGEPDRAAVTLQAVEIRQGGGSARIVLNVLGVLRNGEAALNAFGSALQMRLLGIINGVRRQLEGIAPPVHRGAGARPALSHEAAARASRVMREAARSIGRLGRQRGRRTGHAEERTAGRRPTPKALEDALAAPPERILWDERRRTMVVLGPRRRVHIFSPGGRHVTSLELGAEEVGNRRRRRRWQEPPPEALRDFRQGLKERGGA